MKINQDNTVYYTEPSLMLDNLFFNSYNGAFAGTDPIRTPTITAAAHKKPTQ